MLAALVAYVPKRYASAVSKTSPRLGRTPGEKKRRGNAKVFALQKPKLLAIIGLGFRCNNGSNSPSPR
jgi:hypothetical protein